MPTVAIAVLNRPPHTSAWTTPFAYWPLYTAPTPGMRPARKARAGEGPSHEPAEGGRTVEETGPGGGEEVDGAGRW